MNGRSLGAIAAIAVVGGSATVFAVVKHHQVEHFLLDQLVDAGPAGSAASELHAGAFLAAVIALAIVFCLPGPMLCELALGMRLGLVRGFLVAWTVDLAASTVAFWLGQKFYKADVRKWLDLDVERSEIPPSDEERAARAQSESVDALRTTAATASEAPASEAPVAARLSARGRLRLLLELCDREPWLLLLARLLTLPSWLKNYGPAVINIPPWQFALFAAPGEALYCFVFAYAGSSESRLAGAFAHAHGAAGGHVVAGLAAVGGAAATIIVVVGMTLNGRIEKERQSRLDLAPERKLLLASENSVGGSEEGSELKSRACLC